jgi:hypothetical protein
MTVSVNGTTGITFNDASTQATAAKVGMVNRIINGDFRIDQRNAGAAINPINNNTFTVDRWAYAASQSSKFSAQQNQGSVTTPVGFTNYLGFTSSSAYSVTTTDYFFLVHRIEGYNIADLGWGTANAKTVTLSFQVYSSLTGTFGALLSNNGDARTYPFTYTIPVANTWTTISVTITGDTSGTWLTNNGAGINVMFSLGAGSTRQGTAGAWVGSAYYGVSGQTNVVGTNGATFYITGVQLEKGSTATSFDYRPYGTELALCQRYYEKSFAIGTAPSVANFAGSCGANHDGGSGSNCDVYSIYGFSYKVTKRSAPSITTFSASTVNQIRYRRNTGAFVNGSHGGIDIGENYFYIYGSYGGSGSTSDIRSITFDYVADAEL